MGVSRGEITTRIVKDGLVFNMDAANRASYPRTGTTVTDTIGNTSGTLNSATFSNIDSGVFNFDGTDDKIDLAGGGQDIGINSTVSIWVNLDSGYNGILLGEDGYSFDYLLYPYSTGFYVRIASTALNYSDVPTYLTAGSWHHLAVVRTGDSIEVFVDGISRGTNTGFGTSNGIRFDTIGAKPTGTLPLEGKISSIQAYNRTLSAEEVLYNYNGMKARFGL